MLNQLKQLKDLFFACFFKSVKDMSGKNKLDLTDFAKLLRNGVIYGLGTMAVYVLTQLSGMDFGVYTPLVIGISAGLIDALRKSLRESQIELDEAPVAQPPVINQQSQG